MKQLAYSSTAAFLAHYRLLSNAADGRGAAYPLSSQDQETLKAMGKLMEALSPEERTVLLNDGTTDYEECASSEERRRQERARLKLRQLLVNKGVLRA
jgi:hypothetical protein